MRLALECGRADWEQLADELTPEQFDEWRAFDLVEGLPSTRISYAIAMGFAAVMTTFGSGKTVKPGMFLPKWTPPKESALDADEEYEMKAARQIDSLRMRIAQYNSGV